MKKAMIAALVVAGLFTNVWGYNPDAGLTDDVVYGYEIMAVKLPEPDRAAKPVDLDGKQFTCIKCE